jgi:hypothetical protein
MLSAEREPSDQCTGTYVQRPRPGHPRSVRTPSRRRRLHGQSAASRPRRWCYRLDLRRLRAFRDPRSLLTVSQEDLARFLASLHASGLSRNTLRRQIAVLRSFYAWTSGRTHPRTRRLDRDRNGAAIRASSIVDRRSPAEVGCFC